MDIPCLAAAARGFTPYNFSCFVRDAASKFVPHCYYTVMCVYGILPFSNYRERKTFFRVVTLNTFKFV